MKWQLLARAGVAAAWSQCSNTFENGPCFTAAKSWTEAQKECEKHGSNLATVLDTATNDDLGANGCFTDMPWNDWKCTWIGATDQAVEGTFEWPSGQPFSFNAWGQYEPDTATCEMDQHCAAVCKGGSIDGYSGNFWLDLKCTEELAFCCDEATFVQDAGTAEADSFIENLEVQAPVWCPDPDPLETRRLCFSTRLGWEDAQAMCADVGSNLLVIKSQDELDFFGNNLHFTKVPKSWGLDWQCGWIGMHDRNTEGDYEWMGDITPTFVPPFGPFEAGNGDGTDEDCVALCQSSCRPGDDPCTDLSEYGYTGNFLMDAACSLELSFCCDSLVVPHVEAAKATTQAPTAAPTTAEPKVEEAAEVADQTPAVIALAVVAGLASIVAAGAIAKLTCLKPKTDAGAGAGGQAYGRGV